MSGNALSLKSGLLPKTGSGPMTSSSGSGGGGTPANAYLNGGNSFGALAKIGTNDANDLVVTLGGSPALSLTHATFAASFAGPVGVPAGSLSLGTASAATGALQLMNAGSANALTISAGATSAAYTLTLPTAHAPGLYNVLTAGPSSALAFVDANDPTSGFFLQGGNDFGGVAVLGTTSTNSLILKTHNATALTLDTTQKATFTGAVSVVNGALSLGTSSTATGALQLMNAGSASALTISAGATSAAYTMTLPPAQGGAGTVLTNNGSGALSWTSPSAGYASAPVFAAISGIVNITALTAVPQTILTLTVTAPPTGNWGVIVNYTVSASTFSTADAVYFTATCGFGSCAQSGCDAPNSAVVRVFSASGPMLSYGGGPTPAFVLSLGPSTPLTINLQTYAFYSSGPGQSFSVTFGDSTASSTFPGTTQLSAYLIPL